MRSTPHHDPAADAPIADAAETIAAKTTAASDAATQKLGAAADAVSQKLDATTDAAAQKAAAAVAQGKDWLQNIDVQQLLEQIPQPVRDLGAQVADRVRRLTPTQQIVSGAVLAFGVGLLATRSSRKARTADAKAGKKYRAKYD
ncbi:MAG: hypothetical protein ACRYFR_08505 [Janthinobacterium lividum]